MVYTVNVVMFIRLSSKLALNPLALHVISSGFRVGWIIKHGRMVLNKLLQLFGVGKNKKKDDKKKESIYVRVYEDRIDLIRAAIVGPAGTPYHDGLFFFDVCFPPEYPRCPPKVHFHSSGLRLNPNLYESGKVCLSLLNTWLGSGSEKWGKSNSTMLLVLVSIQGLVLNDKPYFNEPVIFSSKEKHSLGYNQTAFVLTCKMMLYLLQKPPKHFETLIVCHFHERERAILEACRAYASGMVVGSSVKDGRTYLRNKCFAGFKKSLDAQTKLLAKELASNRLRALQLKREVAAADNTISTS